MMNMSMHTPEYHLALESYEILIYAAWMNLENIASSEISQTEDMNDSPYMRYLEQADSQRYKVQQKFPGSGTGEKEILLNETRVYVGDDDKVLGLEIGDGYTA